MRARVLVGCIQIIIIMGCLVFSIGAYSKEAVLLNIDGLIDPGTQNYIENGLAYAAIHQAELVILRLKTTGGLETSMHKIDEAILTSSIPVVTYVATPNSQAIGAGTFILYASHIAAMAPHTFVGRAAPIKLITLAALFEKKNSIRTSLTPFETKKIDDAIANISSLADLHSRNRNWAEAAVRQGVSIAAEDALKLNIIDIVATDIPDLLIKIHGRRVLVNSSNRVLDTARLVITEYKTSAHTRFLTFITHPNIAYLLLLMGIYGIVFEYFRPGFVIPGGSGIIALSIALYAFRLLPLNYFGFVPFLLGLFFMIIEFRFAGFGILGISGMITFVMGSILLLDINTPGYFIAWPLISIMALLTAAFFCLIIPASASSIATKDTEVAHE